MKYHHTVGGKIVQSNIFRINVISKYWHTLKYLRPIQFYGRLWFRLSHPKPDLSAAPQLQSVTGRWVAVAPRRPSLTGPGQFLFLNEAGILAELDWDGPQREKLWRYNQHYFDDLNALNAEARNDWHLALLDDWVERNPPAAGTGWEPYPTSLRIVNWLKWRLAGNPLPQSCIESLAVQARWLTRRLEWHLLGNHLFANAKALLFAGMAFQGGEAKRWRATGLRIIQQELPEQVLPDGGNFERSTMYHAIFLEDVLDLLNLARAFPDHIDGVILDRWRAVAEQMLAWLDGMSHPDGEIALFNDAAFGIAPTPRALREYARRLDIAMEKPPESSAEPKLDLQHWSDSGYVRITGSHAVALLDVAPVGPDYLPGHAHADTLSFELSLFGQRVIVNGGTSCYGSGPVRLRERRTVSHSTVEVDGESSSEVWGGFRVARRAYPFDLELSQANPEMVSVACSHNGYRRLPGKPVHRRTWRMQLGELTVSDSVTGRYESAVARYILHPGLAIKQLAHDVWQLTLPGGEQVTVETFCGRLRLEHAGYAPEFCKVYSTQCMAVKLENGDAELRIHWS